MSSYRRMLRKRRRSFRVFIKNAENIDGVLVFQIHQIPEKVEYGQEFDFWIIDKRDCYMLRIEVSTENIVYFSHSRPYQYRDWEAPLYCIMKIDIDHIDIRKQLSMLKEIGIPYKLKNQTKRELK